MLVLQGKNACSHFRLEKYLSRIIYAVPQVDSLRANTLYLVELDSLEEELEIAALADLLSDPELGAVDKNKNRFFILPEIGTISEWSSRTTEILHDCGLNQIKRIEIGIVYSFTTSELLTWGDQQAIAKLLRSPTDQAFFEPEELLSYFDFEVQQAIQHLDLSQKTQNEFNQLAKILNIDLSLHDEQTKENLFKKMQKIERPMTEVEFISISKNFFKFYFKKILTAQWLIDEHLKTKSLTALIRHTHHKNSKGIVAILNDHLAIVADEYYENLMILPELNEYTYSHEAYLYSIPSLCNQSYTGNIGTEIQEEVAIGRGASSKVGLSGFSVSHLNIPDFSQPWEKSQERSIQSALELILAAPIGAAQFNRQFGRPNLIGYFRTFAQTLSETESGQKICGYHKPLVISSGLGSVSQSSSKAQKLTPGMRIFVLGGSVTLAGTLDRSVFDLAEFSNQNPEMYRRCQAVIDYCVGLGENNPISAIYTPGIGGLSTLLPEITEQHKLGAHIQAMAIPSDPNLTYAQRWCNEAQGRYVILAEESHSTILEKLCLREGCPIASIGELNSSKTLELVGANGKTLLNIAVDVFADTLTSDRIVAHSFTHTFSQANIENIVLEEAVNRVLRFPCVADKSFLITICDRGIGGLVVRDPMVGAWQVPVADCGIVARDFRGFSGDALALGERPPLAVMDAVASAKMAIGEALTNIASAGIEDLSEVHLSISWTGDLSSAIEKSKLYEAVSAIGLNFCPALGVGVPVLQEPVSLKTVCLEEGVQEEIIPPLSLIVNATAPVKDVRQSVTPLLSVDEGETRLLLIDLSGGKQRLGQSVLLQVFDQLSDDVPNVDDPAILKAFFKVFYEQVETEKILAYHDRSDGGLFVTLCEMAFAAHMGLQIDITKMGRDPNSILFNEELGAVIQVRSDDVENIKQAFASVGIQHVYPVATLDDMNIISVTFENKVVFTASRTELHRLWSETSFQLQSLRDNPRCAKRAFEAVIDENNPGLAVNCSFEVSDQIIAPYLNLAKPRLAILREQGNFGHYEMAAAFMHAQFCCVDVHMNDLLSGQMDLDDFRGLVVGGNSSFLEVLGAGKGWAKCILHNSRLREIFQTFLSRSDTFALGISNGCQMLSQLKEIIPGADHWPVFVGNQSDQFEGRFSLVEIQNSASIVLTGMEGSRIAVPVAHREGKVEFSSESMEEEALKQNLVVLRYIDHHGRKTTAYPYNPNGSSQGITGLTNTDGRVTIMMPHPERAYRTIQNPWHPDIWGEMAPWFRLFQNARKWVN